MVTEILRYRQTDIILLCVIDNNVFINFSLEIYGPGNVQRADPGWGQTGCLDQGNIFICSAAEFYLREN